MKNEEVVVSADTMSHAYLNWANHHKFITSGANAEHFETIKKWWDFIGSHGRASGDGWWIKTESVPIVEMWASPHHYALMKAREARHG